MIDASQLPAVRERAEAKAAEAAAAPAPAPVRLKLRPATPEATPPAKPAQD